MADVHLFAEFKRQRLAMQQQQPRSVLPGLVARSPRETTLVNSDGWRTAAAVGSRGSAAAASTLALSPIAVSQAAAVTERGASKSVSATAVTGEAPGPSRVDTSKRPGEAVSLSSAREGSDVVAAEPVRAIEYGFTFTSHPAAPLNPQLRRVKDLCEAYRMAVGRSSVADGLFTL